MAAELQEPILPSNRRVRALPSTWTSRRVWLGREGALVLLVGCYTALFLAFSRTIVSTDSWYALAAGRLVAHTGLPSHNTLTVLGHGRRWVDQQWLGQLAVYGLDRVGGLRLAAGVHVLLVVAALAAAVAIARRRGASPRRVAIVALVALLPLLLSTLQLRTQSFGYVLFVAVLAAVSTSRAVTWRRLAAVLAVLALWGNLHGSVLIGAALVALRGAADLSLGYRRGLRPNVIPSLLVVLPWLALLVTPFPTAIPHYYAQTALNPTFGKYLAQWQPTTLSAISVPVFLLAFGFVWLLARSGSFSRFEKLAGLLVVAGALLAYRNWVWLALFAIAFYPKALDQVRGRVQEQRGVAQLNALLAGVGVAAAAVATTIVFSHPSSWFGRAFPDAAARAVAGLAAEHPQARIWASVRWGDWLLWKEPQLAGRVAYDARMELLTEAQVKDVVLLRVTPALLPSIGRRYPIFLVDRTDEKTVFDALRRQGLAAYDNGEVLVTWYRSRPAGS